jgi:hypothetical protein
MHLYIVMYNLLLYMLDMIRGRGRLSPGASERHRDFFFVSE